MPLQETSAEIVDGLVLDLSFDAVTKVEMTGAGREPGRAMGFRFGCRRAFESVPGCA